MFRELVYLFVGGLMLGVVLTSATRADLVGWWRFDEGSGTVAYDSSGNDHDGTIYGSPSWVSGVGGSALEFDGTNDYVGTGESLLDNMSEFTLACWVRAGNPGSSRIGLIGQNDLIEMGFMSGNIEMWTNVTGTTTTQWIFEDNTWHHIAVSGGATGTKIYLDGELAVTGGGSANYRTSAFPVNIGGGGVWDTSGNWFLGQIDDVRIYNHALSEIEILTAMEGAGEAWPYASDPEPADGTFHLDTWALLSWTPGSTADSHDVYFGENVDDVETGTGGTFHGNQASNDFLVGLPGCPYPDGLVPGTTYYWRIDEVEADGVTKHKGNVWSFFVPSGKAFDPVPPDGAEFVATSVTITWSAGLGAETHTVYFGDDPETVKDAVGGIPQMLNRYYPGELEFDKTYYWRVDDFEGTATYKGDVWSFTTMPEDEFWAGAYYVDGGNRVANDGNPGTEARPFKTIGRGVQSLLPGDTLLIKAGTYRETVILTRSGTQARPIRIQAYPGNEGKVIINAAEPVTSWHKCTGPGECAGNQYWEHIYVADVSALVWSHPDTNFAVRQVFQHGQLLNRSRYPNVGWNYPTSVANPTRTFTDSSLTKSDGYFVGAVCHVRTDIGFLDQILITDFSRHAITLAKSPRYEISTRYGYYITSIVGEINEAGEWAYDPIGKRLYLWPKDDAPENVEFTYRQYCLRSYSGTSWNVVRGLTMRNAYLHGIYLYRSNDMMLEDNTVECAYNFGIYIYAGIGATGDRNQIVHNTIKYCASRGIGVDINCPYTNVEGNYVYGTGTDTYGGDLMNGQGEAIYVSGPYARVYNNRVDHTAHKTLYFDGDTLGREVSYNYITNGGLALSESGGLYTGGFYDKPEKDYIHHNIFENVFGCLSMDRNHDKGLPVTIEKYSGDAPGIYVDERGNNRIIEHNTVINSHMAGIFFHWAPGNIVRNNTLYGNRMAQIWFSGRNQPGERLVDEVVFDNIMFATDAQQKTFYLGINYDDVHFGQSDRNYFYDTFSNWNIYVSRYTGEWIQDDLTLNRWRAMSGYDANSREFSYLDQIEDITINTRKDSRIVYNPSLEVVSIDLGSEKYCDVDGNKIYGSVSLQPFESLILIPCDFEIP
jgi:parallel beta-helix repeat protein